MRLYNILEASIEDVKNRIPLWIKRYGIELNDISDIIAIDPTRGMYSEWLVKNASYYKRAGTQGDIYFDQHKEGIKRVLSKFDKYKHKLAKRDINKYSIEDLLELESELDQFDLTKAERKAARRGVLKIPPGSKLIYDSVDFLGETFSVVKIDDVSAAITLSSGTKWCTANKEAAEMYLDDGPLYLFYKEDKTKPTGEMARYFLVSLPNSEINYTNNRQMDFVDKIKVLRWLEEFEGIDLYQYPMVIIDLVKANDKKRDIKGEKRMMETLDTKIAEMGMGEHTDTTRRAEFGHLLSDHLRAMNKYCLLISLNTNGEIWEEYEDTLLEELSNVFNPYVPFLSDKFMYAAGDYAGKIKRGQWDEAEKLIDQALDAIDPSDYVKSITAIERVLDYCQFSNQMYESTPHSRKAAREWPVVERFIIASLNEAYRLYNDENNDPVSKSSSYLYLLSKSLYYAVTLRRKQLPALDHHIRLLESELTNYARSQSLYGFGDGKMPKLFSGLSKGELERLSEWELKYRFLPGSHNSISV